MMTMWTPGTPTTSNTLNTQSGTLKVMFWNIQTLFGHGIMKLDEYRIEQQVGVHPKTKKPTGATKATVEIKAKDHAKMAATIAGTPLPQTADPFGAAAARREWVTRTIHDSGADIVVIAELAIGTRDIEANLSNQQVKVYNKQSLQNKRGSFVSVDVGGGSWGPEQIQVDLNKLYGLKGNPWHSAVSAINAINDFTCTLVGERIQFKKGKNSLVEMYGLLWRSDKVCLGEAPMEEMIKVVAVDGAGVVLSFRERAPGHVELFSAADPTQKLFDLFCIHNLFGKETGQGAAEKIRQNRGVGIVNLTKLGAFDPGKPTVVVGDFNLDDMEALERGYYKPLTDTMRQRIVKQKSSITKAGLASAYDHVFTTDDLGKAHPDDGVIDIAQKYFGGDYAKALQISDHLPVVAVLTSPLFAPPQPQFLDVFTVGPQEHYGRIQSPETVDSLFVAVANGWARHHPPELEPELERSLAEPTELRKKAATVVWNEGFASELGGHVRVRLDGLYSYALTEWSSLTPKPAEEWILDTEADWASGLRKVVADMLKGNGLDQALEASGVNSANEYYDYFSYVVEQALRDPRNFVARAVPRPVVGIGPNLTDVFGMIGGDGMMQAPSYENAFKAYCEDLATPKGLSGSYIEAWVLSFVVGHPVVIVELNEDTSDIQKTPLGAATTPPITLYRNGDHYDLLWGPLQQ